MKNLFEEEKKDSFTWQRLANNILTPSKVNFTNLFSLNTKSSYFLLINY